MCIVVVVVVRRTHVFLLFFFWAQRRRQAESCQFNSSLQDCLKFRLCIFCTWSYNCPDQGYEYRTVCHHFAKNPRGRPRTPMCRHAWVLFLSLRKRCGLCLVFSKSTTEHSGALHLSCYVYCSNDKANHLERAIVYRILAHNFASTF